VTARQRTLLGWGPALLAIVMMGVALWQGLTRPPGLPRFTVGDVTWALPYVSFSAVGAIIVSRRPRHRVGWVLIAIGVSLAAGVMFGEFGYRLLLNGPHIGRLAAAASIIGSTFPIAGLVLIVVLLLLFPDGSLKSRRWLPVLIGVIAVALGFLLGTVFADTLNAGSGGGYPAPPNPFAYPPLGHLFYFLVANTGFVVYAGLLVAAAISVFTRFRGADLERRQQLKWFTFAGAVVAFTTVIGAVLQLVPQVPGWLGEVSQVAISLALVSLAVSIGIAILRHRLFDIDVVLSRTVTYGVLAALITGVYVGLVVGVGTLVGRGTTSNLLLSVLATAVVAIALQPLRQRLNRLANRLVYGRQAAPYEVLDQFTRQVALSITPEEALPRMAQLLGEATFAQRADVWLHRDGAQVPVAGWPAPDPAARFDTPTEVAEVRHHGRLLGALSVTRRGGEALTPTERRLLDGLALQAGLLLRNYSLSIELRGRLDELKASRQRLVAAQNEERRRLERDLHDGAQQHLVALRVKLGLLAERVETAAPQLQDAVLELDADSRAALESLRDLARGVYPPLLESQGLQPALAAQVRRLSLPVDVVADSTRYPRDVEGAVYFCCSEALQNLAKHSQAHAGSITVERSNGHVRFEVRDDGRGFEPSAAAGSGLQNMRDRVEALGGRLEVRSGAGEGTTVEGWLPVGG
jgi:signal transduction histidine kinase